MAKGTVVLVTGGGGFIGGRAVEMLHAGGYVPRATVRRWGTAARIGRLPIEIVQCDITSASDVDRAMEGADHVIHCAAGAREATVDGTRNVLDAALRHGIGRVVHMSTIDVYGEAVGDVAEDRPLEATGTEYGDAKIEAEALCREYGERGLSVTILRPTIVYGPFSKGWTLEFAERLGSGTWLLPDEDCQGDCNLVYVDDLVRAALLALEADGAEGQAFNVNGPDRVTWSEYFHALNDEMGLPPIGAVNRTASRVGANLMMPVRKSAKWVLNRFGEPVMALYQRYGWVQKIMRGAESLIRQTPTTNEFRLYSKKAVFPSGKAQRLMGYRPAFSMQDGVGLSVRWLEHHRIGNTSRGRSGP